MVQRVVKYFFQNFGTARKKESFYVIQRLTNKDLHFFQRFYTSTFDHFRFNQNNDMDIYWLVQDPRSFFTQKFLELNVGVSEP